MITLTALLARLHRLRVTVRAAFEDAEFTDPEATAPLTYTPIVIHEPPIDDEATRELHYVKPLYWPCPYCRRKIYEYDFTEHLETCKRSLWNRRRLGK